MAGSNSDSELLQMEKIRLSPSELSAVVTALSELDRPIGREYHPVKLSWRKYLGVRLRGVTLVRISTFCRPPDGSVAGIQSESREKVLFPALRPQDFARCCEILGFNRADEKERFAGFLAPRALGIRR